MAIRGPDVLRPVVQLLHWTTVLVIAAYLVDRAPSAVVLAHAAVWAGITLVWGMRGGPSPALSGWIRTAAQMSHWALLALYLIGGILAVLGMDASYPVLLAVIGLGALHGVFNLWRSSVLGDGALRRMLPKALH